MTDVNDMSLLDSAVAGDCSIAEDEEEPTDAVDTPVRSNACSGTRAQDPLLTLGLIGVLQLLEPYATTVAGMPSRSCTLEDAGSCSAALHCMRIAFVGGEGGCSTALCSISSWTMLMDPQKAAWYSAELPSCIDWRTNV